MGTVFRPHKTKPLPQGAQIVVRNGKRMALWQDAQGRSQKAEVTGPKAKEPGIRVKAKTYLAQYKDADGVVRREPTGCRSLDSARAVLSALEARVEKVRAGMITQAELNAGDHADTPIADHATAYVAHLSTKRGKGARRSVSSLHVANVEKSLRQACAECGFKRLRDLHREPVERWVHRLLNRPDADLLDSAGSVTTPRRPAARTVNVKLTTLTAWGNWLVESGRLVANPFARLRKLDEADDVRRQRRALTAAEIDRLLTVARLRPLAQFGRPKVRIIDPTRPARSRATWKREELTFDMIAAAAECGRTLLRPEVAADYDRLGRERALIYRVLLTTGLRRGELAAITVGDVLLDDARWVIVLKGVDAKNGKRALLPLRADVASELRAWIDEKTAVFCREGADFAGGVRAVRDLPLFEVPDKLSKILDRDLRAADIPKRDDRGRTVDVHAMRATFASHLARAGVSPVTLKTLMRHAKIETTLKHYADPALLDVAGAVELLPSMTAAHGAPSTEAVALPVALTTGQDCQNVAIPDPSAARTQRRLPPVRPALAAENAAGMGIFKVGDTGLEPVTPSLSS